MTETPVHELQGDTIPWEKVTQEEYRLIAAIAERADMIFRAWIAKRRLTLEPGKTLLEPDRMVIQMDVAVAHICRTLDLVRLLHADELSFIGEIVTIQTNVNRVDGRIPDYVHLSFTRTNG